MHLQEVLETLSTDELLELVSIQGMETLRQYPIIKRVRREQKHLFKNF
jgi:hypothetical protein